MAVRKVAAAGVAAVFALSGIGSVLIMQQQPSTVEAIDLSDDDSAIRREQDDGPALEVADDRDDDDTNGGNTGDGDGTDGNDGTNGGNNTGDNSGGDSGGDSGSGGGTDD